MNISKIQVNKIIDADGKVLTPGFIDTHAHGDPLKTPNFENFLAMGVTTICLGQDGSSPPYTDLRTWMAKVDSVEPAVNIALFVGHGSLRHLSGVGYATKPKQMEIQNMAVLLKDALDAGCFGMSTGLEYTPGMYAGEAELTALAKIVGSQKGLISSHIRNEDDDAIEASLKELLKQGQYCNVQASHLKVVYGKGEKRAETILAMLAKARQETPYTVTADVYPYTASYTGIGIVFPTWAKSPNNYEQVKRERKSELLQFLKEKIIARNGSTATLFGTPPFAGKTLQQVSEEQGRLYEEVLFDLGPTGASGAYFVMNEALQGRLMEDPSIMICSDGSPTMRHPRGYGSFSKIIEQYVLHEKRFSLPEAIRKMTSLSAQTIGIQQRGAILPGYKADLLIFDPATIKTRATFSDPHQLSTGMEYVFVNGKLAFQRQKIVERPGLMLRKESGE